MNKKLKYENFLINYKATIIEAILKIQINKRGDLLVIKNKKIIGTVSSGDIMRSLLTSKVLESSIEKIINYNFKYLKKRDFKEAKNIFINYGISLIPLLSNNFELNSLISLNDVLNKKN